MMQLNKGDVIKASKWSVITEFVAKLITPITSMVLARLLLPEEFGVVATITMIVSFVEIFTDAGFQKYIIQHEFADEQDKEQSVTVAFWSNFILSLVLWLIISIFSERLATLVGNSGLGNVITIACVSIPLVAFSSIQVALYKRDFDFKTLFKVRIIGILVPLVVTIPLAFYLRSFWSIIIGTIVMNIVNAIVLTLYSKWKPRLFFSFNKLKEMFSFSFWSMIESISIWLTNYIDIFIIGIYLNEHLLGIYKMSMTIVSQITSLVVASTTPILFSALSRLQNDMGAFKNMFFKFQKLVGLLIFPLGVGIFCFRFFITDVFLGNQWREAANFVGLWGLTSAITIVLSYYCSEVYRSLGKPKLSVLAQLLHIIVLCPVMIIVTRFDWTTVYVARSIVRLELVLVNLIIVYYFVGISPWQMLSNVKVSIFAAVIMGFMGYILLEINSSFWWTILVIFICIIVYFILIFQYKNERLILCEFLKKLKNKK